MRITLTALVLFLFVFSVGAQNSQVSINLPEQKPKRVWKIEMEAEARNALESPNKIELVDSAVISYRTNYFTDAGKYTFRIGGQAVIPVNREQEKFFGTVELEVTRHFRQFTLSADSQFWLANRKRIGITSFTLSKTVELKEEQEVTPFTKLSYYFPLENGLQQTSNGLVWTSGIKFDGKVGKANQFNRKQGYEFITQVIADNGAIHSGNRSALNFEGGYLFPIRNFSVGPKFGYTAFLSGHFEKRHVFNCGLWVKIR